MNSAYLVLNRGDGTLVRPTGFSRGNRRVGKAVGDLERLHLDSEGVTISEAKERKIETRRTLRPALEDNIQMFHSSGIVSITASNGSSALRNRIASRGSSVSVNFSMWET